ncbi:unnamed protein product [Oppiella nova]|uniref:Uncharacterized protein n=1 Tax=Oppiella nova TaxID=334625 RepID=A0A7R9MUX9_9ACAR|nr:unnamed protein product [Oppiella nova]CAG2183842.1 unnamed protein product [Oppiella nova]
MRRSSCVSGLARRSSSHRFCLLLPIIAMRLTLRPLMIMSRIAS